MRVVKIILGVLFFGSGVAFVAMGAVDQLIHPVSGVDVAIPAMFGSIFLLGGYLLLRPATNAS
jgi:hypothetical protein